MKVLVDLHHTDLYRSFQLLFEKRFGWEVYRPLGREWFDRGYFYHPRDDEVIGLLTEQCPFIPGKHKTVFDAPEGVLFRNANPDGMLFRWMTLDEVHSLDYIVCSVYRNEQQFWKLKKDFGLKAPIIRYTGNGGEQVDPSKFDIFLPALLCHYEEYVKSGRKPGILYHPEFDLNRYCPGPLPVDQKIIRTFLNFIYHHRDSGAWSPWEQWCRYCGYADEIKALHLIHGLGTPPPGVEVDLDVIIDISFEKMGLGHLKDRSKWPDLKFNRGEPPNHEVIANLMKHSNIVVHAKTSPPEGYGFVVHQIAASGRPMVIPQHYKQLSAVKFLQHRETCLFITGENEEDKANFKWAMEPENNQRMSETMHKRFLENVNFEDEAAKIRALL
jgi:hypothetical protein